MLCSYFFKAFLCLASTAYFCEVVIHHLGVAFSPSCVWPTVDEDPQQELRVLFLADVHLLGSRRGHWFDRLRRERQARSSFEAAVTWLKPEAIFILGDLFDEGKWARDEEWLENEERARILIASASSHGIPVHILAGNHDVGDYMPGVDWRARSDRFKAAYGPTNRVVTLKGIPFLLLDSLVAPWLLPGCLVSSRDPLFCWTLASLAASQQECSILLRICKPCICEHCMVPKHSLRTKTLQLSATACL